MRSLHIHRSLMRGRFRFSLVRSSLARRRAVIPSLAGVVLIAVTASPVFAQSGSGGDYEGPIGVTGIFNGNMTTGCSYDPLTHSAPNAWALQQ